MATGLAWVMVLFAVLAVLAIGFVYRYLPETKGVPLEEITELFEREAEGKAVDLRHGAAVPSGHRGER